ncbi:hypothetical protein WJX79_005762 [Trebouxia sp. C0005]
MAEWLTLLDRLDIPDGAVTGLSASDKPVLKGKLLQLPAADRPLFFDGPPLEILKTLRTLLPDAPSGVSAPIDRFGGRGQDGQTSVLNSLVDSVKTIAEMVLRIQATTSETFDNIFAPNISELSQRTNLVTKTCTTAYNAENRPKDQLWCMVLGRYLEEDLVKASHIYKRRWPVTYAANLHLDVDSAANMFSAQKKIKRAFDRFRLIIVPESLTAFKVSCAHFGSLGPQMINNNTQNAAGSPIRFAELDGTLLHFATEARPAKRAFAWS